MDGEGLSTEVADLIIAKLNATIPLDVHVVKTMAAIRSADEQIEVDFPYRGPPTDCCMGCVYGDAYTQALKAQARRVRWLIELLKKRKDPADRRLLNELRERLRDLE